MASVGSSGTMAGLIPTYLRCEHLVDPLGIDVARPRLGWVVESDQRNQRQTAFQLLVSDTREALERSVGTLWDSGRVDTDETARSYAGQPLPSRRRCYWKVRVWDRDGVRSDWSPAAHWTMGLLERADWRARWIGYGAPYAAVLRSGHVAVHEAGARSPVDRLLVPLKALLRLARALKRWVKSESSARRAHSVLRAMAEKLIIKAANAVSMRRYSRFRPVLPPCPYLRKEFGSAHVVRGTLYASALGIYEVHINGKRVGDACFAPGWTDYARRVYYQTYDVTGLLEDGQNAIGAILADGWYAGYLGPWRRRGYYGAHPWLIAQLELERSDGSILTVMTDSTWKAATGPHLEADLLMGETYDARLEMPGWSKPGYDDSAWSPVTIVEGIGTNLRAMLHPPVRKTGEVRPVRVWAAQPGRHVFDMGQNFAGWVRVNVDGPAGTRLVLRFAERLNPDGTIYRVNLRGARATDSYVLSGGPAEWEPRFTLHGFQYVEMTGYPGSPRLETITGIVAHTDTLLAGHFECSSPMVNKLYENIMWTQRANFGAVPTDCPQRDERLGWLGDAQVFARTATYNMDLVGLLGKWLVDVADAQSPEGAYPEIAPQLPGTLGGIPGEMPGGTPGWADAGIICPWILYQVYGDRRIIERHYDGMKRWIEYIQAANPRLLWTERTGLDLGDWLALDEGTPKDVLATGYFAYDASLLAKMASAVGRTEDAEKYARLAQAIREAFRKAYVSPDGRVTGETQTCYALALHFGLVPGALQRVAGDRLLEAIEARQGHLSTGFFGTAYLAPALTATGHLETAYRILLNDTFPSWGYWIRQGATSLWERWDGWTETAGFQAPIMNSFSHYAFGSIGEWLFTTIAGIDADEPGFKHIRVHPRPGGGLTYAKGHYDSVSGRVSTSWRIDGGTFHLDVSIPANTTATVFVPARDVESVTEGGRPLAAASDIAVDGIEDGSVVLRIGSGQYEFRADS